MDHKTMHINQWYVPPSCVLDGCWSEPRVRAVMPTEGNVRVVECLIIDPL